MTGSEDAPAQQDSRAASSAMIRSPVRLSLTDGGSETPRESSEKRHRILRMLRAQLERHPAVIQARGIPEGNYAQIDADLNPLYFGRDASEAILRVSWQPNPTFPPGTSLDDRRRTLLTANFVFHYSESTGFDCGFHLEPNPHVAGHLHYQERDSSDAVYSYEEFELDAAVPVGVLWEVIDALEARLSG